MIKLLNPNLTSYGGCQWVVGEWKETDGTGDLCGPGWLHGYESAELAVLLNPIHANIRNPVGYWIEVGGRRQDDFGLKFGVTRMRIVRPVVLPVYTTEQYIRFAIRCVLAVDPGPDFRVWALQWLTGQNRSPKAAEAVAVVLTEAAPWATAWAAASPAWAAVRAAWAAARAAEVKTALPLTRYAQWALTNDMELL